ncbi:MAG: type II secretion system GspH family protein [Chloroflexi bacterium]|nr:type II secretion system GspH family protein [Chloroflexota bacterium]
MKKKRGVTLVEILIAMGILAIGFSVAFQSFFSIFAVQDKSRKRVVAIQLARTILERALFDADNYIWVTDNDRIALNRPNLNGTVTTVNQFPSTTDPYSTNPPYYCAQNSYHSIPHGFPRTGDNFGPETAGDPNYVGRTYYYRVESRRLSDPNFLFYDQVARRISVYITLPPLDPSQQGWNKYPAGTSDAQCEAQALREGFIVVLSSFKTRRQMETRMLLPVSSGDVILTVADNSIFAAFLTTDDGMGGSDLDYQDPYTSTSGASINAPTFKAPFHEVPEDKGNYTAVICPDPQINWNAAPLDSQYTGFNDSALDRFQTTNDPMIPNPGTWPSRDSAFYLWDVGPTATNDDYFKWWEKIQVVGTGWDSANRQTLIIRNIRRDPTNPDALNHDGDARSWTVGVNPRGVCFPYPIGRIIKSYINISIQN